MGKKERRNSKYNRTKSRFFEKTKLTNLQPDSLIKIKRRFKLTKLEMIKRGYNNIKIQCRNVEMQKYRG